MAKRIEPVTRIGREEGRAWKALEAHQKKVRELHLSELFANAPQRADKLTAEAAGIYFDYSKNRITPETLRLLIQLAEECELQEHIEAMFRGDKINITENRPALHVALRAPRQMSIVVNGENVVPRVHGVLEKMANFSNAVRTGLWLGHTANLNRNIVNIGIGGSDLGPVMAYDAVSYYSDRTLEFHAVLNSLAQIREELRCTALAGNVPVLMGLLSVCYTRFDGARAIAALPNDHNLRHLPAFLQHLLLERNGNSVSLAGSHVA